METTGRRESLPDEENGRRSVVERWIHRQDDGKWKSTFLDNRRLM